MLEITCVPLKYFLSVLSEHGTTIMGSSGDIASPGYPTKFVHEDVYDWTIIAPDRMFISVQFTVLEIPSPGVNGECFAFIKVSTLTSQLTINCFPKKLCC